MNEQNVANEYDVIIVGSGTCGATIARELCKQNKKVLILERGGDLPLKESLSNFMSIADMVSVGKKLSIVRGIAAGGSSSIYFAVADIPPLDEFRKLGIDLTKDLESTKKELPIIELPDEYISSSSLKLRDSANELGFNWKKKSMFIDQSLCKSGYTYESKWKVKSYLKDAIEHGAKLETHAMVKKVLFKDKQAIGVEYQNKSKKLVQVYGTKIVVSAGSSATPIILRDSGVRNIENHGFFIDPNCALFGFVPGLNGSDNYFGCMSTDYEDGTLLGDGNTIKSLFKMLMLVNLKFSRLFSFSNSIGIGVKVKDNLSGELLKNGKYFKQLTKEDYARLKKGEEQAMKILKNAGAKHIFSAGYGATDLGGTLEIGKHVDKNLQTEYNNLYVCDGSLIPENVRVSPTLTLICLGKYLANNLFPAS